MRCHRQRRHPDRGRQSCLGEVIALGNLPVWGLVSGAESSKIRAIVDLRLKVEFMFGKIRPNRSPLS